METPVGAASGTPNDRVTMRFAAIQNEIAVSNFRPLLGVGLAVDFALRIFPHPPENGVDSDSDTKAGWSQAVGKQHLQNEPAHPQFWNISLGQPSPVPSSKDQLNSHLRHSECALPVFEDISIDDFWNPDPSQWRVGSAEYDLSDLAESDRDSEPGSPELLDRRSPDENVSALLEGLNLDDDEIAWDDSQKIGTQGSECPGRLAEDDVRIYSDSEFFSDEEDLADFLKGLALYDDKT
ncbi:hypothetical protein HKX48_008172 [Thoreauomyces humboldtii]|nr:hypothetical protein HKX48_008172 [Thoreauomyces humboldtii]